VSVNELEVRIRGGPGCPAGSTKLPCCQQAGISARQKAARCIILSTFSMNSATSDLVYKHGVDTCIFVLGLYLS
jgi:hypothetical protein